ncbi:polyribonucleotide nucleotidyltransferase [Candidatus Parcubacteria bacterium]|nr:polyribonucleotide nucleotidyltransferase [Candidatus Parcubacteria bacterium]
MKEKIYKLDIDGKELIIKITDLTEQASGSCLIQYGDTLVLATAVMSKQEREGIDFFPLSVEYQERFYAAGKILGSRYIRRESRPSDEAILTARLIDRTIRPLFPENLKKEIQVVLTCLSWDRENDPDIICLIAASLSLASSDIPWSGPIASVRVGRLDNKFILNPTYEQREKSDFDLVISGIEKNHEILINMLEGEGQETEEDAVLQAVKFSMPYLKKLISFQKQIIQEIGKEKSLVKAQEQDIDLEKDIKEFLEQRLEKIENLGALKDDLLSFVAEKYPEPKKINYAKDIFEKEIEKALHQRIIAKEERPDSRKLDETREISCATGILPRTHGSGLFCRGLTKTLSILTLGAPGDVRFLEGMEIVGKKRFMHHYNFPAYCVGEVKPFRGPGRREIGHGMLAEKALLPLIPDSDEFPYTIRIVSENLSSNGSTSMASISSSCLALMDAGVPIKTPVAGIAIGLIQDSSGNYKILTDIQGPEDHYGDMDFKVAGTEKGITAIQMDVKIKGITEQILKQALEQGKKARKQILEKMKKTIASPRTELSPFAPKIKTLQINPEKIREVIGPGGKIINKIIEDCGVTIDIEDSGKIFVASESEQAVDKAMEWIKNITREVEIGEIFQGKVKRILDFGAFVEILPGQDGLVHISELAPYRVEKVEDIVKIGDTVSVKVISVDEQGRINLSIKQIKEQNDHGRKHK